MYRSRIKAALSDAARQSDQAGLPGVRTSPKRCLAVLHRFINPNLVNVEAEVMRDNGMSGLVIGKSES
jgi:hypothetical protein